MVLELLKDNIVYILVGFVLISIIIGVIKTMLKWVLVYATVLILSFILVNDYKELNKGNELQKLKQIETSFLNDLQSEIKYLTYFDEANGGFTLKSDKMLIYGMLDSKKVNVVYKGEKYVFDKSPIIERVIKDKRDTYLKYKYGNSKK